MPNLNAFLGEPVQFRDWFKIYPPKIKEMVTVSQYNIYQKVLTISYDELSDALHKEPIEETPQFTVPIELSGDFAPKPIKFVKDDIKVPSPLEYLLVNSQRDKGFEKILRNAIKFFTHEDSLILYEQQSIYIGDLTKITTTDIKHLPILKEDNFLEFQNAVRALVGLPQEVAPDPDEDPRITRMRAKARYRDKVKAKSGRALSFDSMLVAICCMGIGITPLNIGELSYSSLSALLQMSQNKEAYEVDVQSLLAGADPKKVKPKHWIANLNE